MPVYTFGEDSPMMVRVSDKVAANYNAAVTEFFKARQRFNQKFGVRWDPALTPVRVKWSKDQQKAWNKVADILAAYTKMHGSAIKNTYMDDFLVKKGTGSVARSGSKTWNRGISLACGAGLVYVLLRGL